MHKLTVLLSQILWINEKTSRKFKFHILLIIVVRTNYSHENSDSTPNRSNVFKDRKISDTTPNVALNLRNTLIGMNKSKLRSTLKKYTVNFFFLRPIHLINIKISCLPHCVLISTYHLYQLPHSLFISCQSLAIIFFRATSHLLGRIPEGIFQ